MSIFLVWLENNFVRKYSINSTNSTHPRLLTILVHSHLETLLEPARLALVPVRLVDHARAIPGLTSG